MTQQEMALNSKIVFEIEDSGLEIEALLKLPA
jgi:hypothetical protein